MASLNKKATSRSTSKTHEGAAVHKASDSPYNQLRKAVTACFLWEDTFYESGVSIADRIKALVPQVDPARVSALAVTARSSGRIRHAPLLLTRELARHPKVGDRSLIGDTVRDVIQRADELSEFLSLYWKDKKQPLSNQVKRGLAEAFTKFDGYQLAKYNRDTEVKLRDVLFLCHAKPTNPAQAAIWKQLVDGTLPAPDTWEVALSGGADKKATFERLLTDKKLGYMALLRNLRNMKEAGVPKKLIVEALNAGAGKNKALPFRFIAAANAVPDWKSDLEAPMLAAVQGMEKLPGKTAILVDCSGSMQSKVSGKSDITCNQAGAALSLLAKEICEDSVVYGFGDRPVRAPGYRGFALADWIANAGDKTGWGTMIGLSVREALKENPDRVIVVTDTQSMDSLPKLGKVKGYILNVAAYRNSVGYGEYVNIDGFSEASIDYIREYEKEAA